jgi:hypothetical protein
VLHDLNSGNRCCLHPDAQPAENKAYFNASHRERALYTMAQALLNFGLGLASVFSEFSGGATRGNLKATTEGRDRR